jgi:hypothetical protein
MRFRKAMCFAISCAGLLFAQSGAVPAFEQFPATEKFSGKSAAPVLKTADDRKFRTRLSEAAARGPNFAGVLTIGTWGCGSSCLQLAAIDARTGEIYHGLPDYIAFGTPMKFADGAEAYSDKFEPVSYRANSRLLIVRGCPKETGCALYAFEWTGKAFRLIDQFPVK